MDVQQDEVRYYTVYIYNVVEIKQIPCFPI